MKHNVVDTLVHTFPEVGVSLQRAQTCIVQYTYWPFNPRYRVASWRTVVSQVRNEVVYQLDLRGLPHNIQPVLLCYLRVEMAYALRGRELNVAGIPVLGWMGLYEGGMDFFGADDRRIRTEDWSSARNYAIQWCEQRWKH